MKTIMDSGKVGMTEGGEKSVMDFGKVGMTEGGRSDAAHDLTDEDIENCNDILQKGDGPLHVEALLGALGATLREVQRHRSALAADKDRIREEVTSAVVETLDEYVPCLPGKSYSDATMLVGHKIAARAMVKLATPASPLRDALARVDHLTKLHALAERAMNSAYAASGEFQRLAEERGDRATDLEVERNAYRDMLGDLLSTMGPKFARALELLNGPTTSAAPSTGADQDGI